MSGVKGRCVAVKTCQGCGGSNGSSTVTSGDSFSVFRPALPLSWNDEQLLPESFFGLIDLDAVAFLMVYVL